MYASFLGISEALHLDIFKEPLDDFLLSDNFMSKYREFCRPV